MSSSNRIAVLLVGALALLGVFGCDSASVSTVDNSTYRIDGALVVDPNIDTTRIVVSLDRNDTSLTTAQVAFAGHSLTFCHPPFSPLGVYSYFDTLTTPFLDGLYGLSVIDADRFGDTLSLAVADTFRILTVSPPNRLIQGTGSATLSWTGSAGAEAYILVAVKTDHAYTGVGYSAYSFTGTGGTIPPEAFLASGTPNPDTGLYNLYVYALTGSPDSMLSRTMLPVPLPEERGDNVDERRITGRLGAAVITRTDTVRVVYQP